VGTLLVPGLLLLLKVPFVFGLGQARSRQFFLACVNLRLGTFSRRAWRARGQRFHGPRLVGRSTGWLRGTGHRVRVLELMAVAGMAVNVALNSFQSCAICRLSTADGSLVRFYRTFWRGLI
jgi:hypothetical protein